MLLYSTGILMRCLEQKTLGHAAVFFPAVVPFVVGNDGFDGGRGAILTAVDAADVCPCVRCC